MRRYTRGWLWLALPITAGFLLFYIIPLGYSAYYSLVDASVSRAYVGLSNYEGVLSNRFFRLAVNNTFVLMGVAVPVLVACALALALFIHGFGVNSALLEAALLLPLLLPSAAITPIFQKMAGLVGVRLPVYAVFLWKYLGLFMLIMLCARRAIPLDYYEAARLDGARAPQLFKGITLPLMLPCIGFTAVIGAVYNLRIFKEVYLMYGAYPEESIYLTQHYMNNQFEKLNYPGLTASSLLFTACLACITLAVFLIAQRRAAR